MIDYAAFGELVRDAFAHLHDPPRLRNHPLARLLGSPSEPLAGEALRRVLLAAVEELKPPLDVPSHTVSWRRYRYLAFRYREGWNHDRISRELLISTRQARRDHLDGLEALSSLLWDRYQASNATEDDSAPVPSDTLPLERTDPRATLDAELSRAQFPTGEAMTDLHEVLAGVVEIARGLAARLGSSIEAAFPAALPPTTIDRTILRQILLSLLSSAIEMGPTRRFRISATTGDATIDLRIVGIEPAGPEPTPGERVAPSADEVEALLAVGQHLAERHGVGVRLVRSEATPFELTVVVPAARSATVLVIDDNPEVAYLFERYLRGTSYRLLHAKSWQRALRLARDAQPDVITLDVMMPSQDGWDVLRHLKDDVLTRDIPVVVCSVLPERSIALTMGVADFLAKPVTQQSLLGALERCRSTSRSARQGSS